MGDNMSKTIRVGLCGIGRAGKEFIEYLIASANDIELCVVLCREISTSAGKLVGNETGIKLDIDIRIKRISEFDNSENVDVIVDFSATETSLELHKLCCKYGINLVICPNAFTNQQVEMIKEKTVMNHIGVVYAPVLTVGVNVLMDYVKKISRIMNEASFEIIEMHGKNKSKPTKTAQLIANEIEQEIVPIHSIRLDGFVGVHEVIMTDGLENIEIVHKSLNRGAFARAAVMALRYVHRREGFYYMNDVVNYLIYEKGKKI